MAYPSISAGYSFDNQAYTEHGEENYGREIVREEYLERNNVGYDNEAYQNDLSNEIDNHGSGIFYISTQNNVSSPQTSNHTIRQEKTESVQEKSKTKTEVITVPSNASFPKNHQRYLSEKSFSASATTKKSRSFSSYIFCALFLLFILAVLVISLGLGFGLGLKRYTAPTSKAYEVYVKSDDTNRTTVFNALRDVLKHSDNARVEPTLLIRPGLYGTNIIINDINKQNIDAYGLTEMMKKHLEKNPVLELDINNDIWVQESSDKEFNSLEEKLFKKNENKSKCVEMPFPLCLDMSYKYTIDLTYQSSFNTTSSVDRKFIQNYGAKIYFLYEHIIRKNCSKYSHMFICSVAFPKCLGGGENQTYIPPCRQFCQQLEKDCKLTWNCEEYPVDNHPDVCFSPLQQLPASWKPKECSQGYFLCSDNKKCIAKELECNNIGDCDDGSDELNCKNPDFPFECSFEHSDWCIFTQSADSNYFWKISRAGSSVRDIEYVSEAGNGINSYNEVFKDASTKSPNGWVLVSQSTRQFPNSSSIIHTRSFELSNNRACLTFKYIMYGFGRYFFNVFASNRYENSPTLMWFQNLGQLSPPVFAPLSWRKAIIPMYSKPENNPIRLIFQVINTDFSPYNDVLLDDVKVSNGDCAVETCLEIEARCSNSSKCILKEQLCDSQYDCEDASDEIHCECSKSQWRCEMGGCVDGWRRCDRAKDCMDGSDEKECLCPGGQVECSDKCIMKEWLCDGEVDCANREDEKNCSVPACMKFKCDGKVDCANGADEEECMKIDTIGLVRVWHGNQWLPVCAEGISVEEAKKMCNYNNQNFLEKSSLYMNNSDFTKVSINGSSNLYPEPIKCSSNEALLIKCKKKACGSRDTSSQLLPQKQPLKKTIKSSLGTLIVSSSSETAPVINGVDSKIGKWPWVAALYYRGFQLCGASLIDGRHILTAAHCFKDDADTSLYHVMLGSVDKTSPFQTDKDSNEKLVLYLKIIKIMKHPEYINEAYTWGKDIAVGRLERDISLETYQKKVQENHIRPVCLAGNELIGAWSVCYGAGWGLMNYQNSSSSSRYLQEVKLNLWHKDQCVRAQPMVEDGMLCAGYESGFLATCKGDSGGPLMCRNGATQSWKLVGVYSFLTAGCNTTMKPPVYTNVSHYLSWIKNQTTCPFYCDNSTKCLWDERKICDGTNDCDDKQDEERIDVCEKSVNCSFENDQKCGYHVLQSYPGWHVRSLDTLPSNSGPVSQHTPNGRKFLSGGSSNSLILSPLFQVLEPSCLQLQFLSRGLIGQGYLKVYALPKDKFAYNLTRESIRNYKVYQTHASLSDSNWYPIKKDLAPGSYFLCFESYTLSDKKSDFIGIDDVKVTSNTCTKQLECQGDDVFICTGLTESPICRPKEKIQCNFVANCLSTPDELSCFNSTYECDMEDHNGCQLRQPGSNDDDYDWVVLKAAESHRMDSSGPLTDHTTGNVNGHILLVDTSYAYSGKTAFVDISMLVSESKGIDACFQFYLSMVSSATLTISQTTYFGHPNKRDYVLQSVNQEEWTLIEIQLDFFTSKIRIASKADFSYAKRSFKDYIAIDDLKIYRGTCKNLKGLPALPCHQNSIYSSTNFFCDYRNGKNQNFCLNREQECNFISNCPNGKDEIICEGGFVCANEGKVEKQEVCDGVINCYGADDELRCFDNSCGAGKFQCGWSGECIDQKSKCDGARDCADGSDETDCPCRDGEYYCKPLELCVSNACFCPDVASGCVCDTESHFQCGSGDCVGKDWVCNGEENCLDASDESNCPCKANEDKCPNGKCIQKEWICDGYEDCVGGQDEKNCTKCGDEEFQCRYRYECVPLNKLCEGFANCKDASDEHDCLKIGDKGVLLIKKGEMLPVCYSIWMSEWNGRACEMLGKNAKGATSSFISMAHNGSFLKSLVKDYKLFTLANFQTDPDCPSNNVVTLSCAEENKCGIVDNPIVTSYVVGGEKVSESGTWPFISAVMRFNKYICSGSIISPTHILTAAHCFIYGKSFADRLPWYYSVRVGSTKRIGPDTHLQVRKVKRIHIHYQYKSSKNSDLRDIAIIELEKPLSLNKNVKPACLPKSRKLAPLCYVLGWGLTSILDFEASAQAVQLREGKIIEYQNSECQSFLPPGLKIDNTQTCAGYPSKNIKPCAGDSGGPLLCKDLRDRWVVKGIISQGENEFGMCFNNKLNTTIFTKVEEFQAWIETITQGEAVFIP